MICPYYYDYLAALISSHSSQPSCQVFDFAWAELESGCKVYASPLSFRSSPQLQPGEDTNVPACLSARHTKMKWSWNWTFCSKLYVSHLSSVHRTPSEAPQWRTCYVPKWQTFLFLGIWTCCLTVPVTWKLDGCLYWVDHFGNYPISGGHTCIICTHPIGDVRLTVITCSEVKMS